MVKVDNIEVVYNRVIQVLKGVSVNIPDEKVIGLLGANGAGKSTVLKSISGLLKPEIGKVTTGKILLNGQSIENGDPEKIARMGILQVLEGRRVLEHFTVEEELRIGGALANSKDMLKQNLERVYGYFPILKEIRNSTSGYCSGGEQQIIVMARALMGSPSMLLLDEPSLGLAPLIVNTIFSIIKRINEEERVSILLVEQNAVICLNVANYIYVMENGKIVLDGHSEKIKENKDIKEFYLGLNEIGKSSYKDVKHYKRRKRWLG